MRQNLPMNFSVAPFFSEAFCTMSIILAAAESPYSLTVSPVAGLSRTTQPALRISPSAMVTGRLSPVRAEASAVTEEPIILQSRGTRSPTFIKILVPTAISSARRGSMPPSVTTFAISGRISARAAMLSLERSTARSSSPSPKEKSRATMVPSRKSPMANAAITAMVIRVSSPKSRRKIPFMPSIRVSRPATTAAARQSQRVYGSRTGMKLSANRTAQASTMIMSRFVFSLSPCSCSCS